MAPKFKYNTSSNSKTTTTTANTNKPAVKNVSETEFFAPPGTDNETANTQEEQKLEEGVKGIDSATDKSKSRAKDVASEAYATPKSDLHVNDGVNIAKTGGQFGPLNNKTFSKTLRLMREADAYNNTPIEDIHRIGLHGVQNLGPGYQRPEITTEEMREMERNRALDASQKQFAVQLQAAVNAKDLDTFKRLYEFQFGVELSRGQAEVLMQQYLRQNQISNIIGKDFAQFRDKWAASFNEDLLQAAWQMQKRDPQYAQRFLYLVTNGRLTTPELEDRLLQETKAAYQREAAKLFPNDPIQQYYYAEQKIASLKYKQNNTLSEQLKTEVK